MCVYSCIFTHTLNTLTFPVQYLQNERERVKQQHNCYLISAHVVLLLFYAKLVKRGALLLVGEVDGFLDMADDYIDMAGFRWMLRMHVLNMTYCIVVLSWAAAAGDGGVVVFCWLVRWCKKFKHTHVVLYVSQCPLTIECKTPIKTHNKVKNSSHQLWSSGVKNKNISIHVSINKLLKFQLKHGILQY